MTAADRLAELLGGVEQATAVREQLALRSRRIRADSDGWTAGGYTGARLVAVVHEHIKDPPRPMLCIAKICPRDSGKRESTGHYDALDEAPKRFRKRHLVEIAFPPILCPDGSVVFGQEIATGTLARAKPLSKLADTDRVTVCRAVRRALLLEWTDVDPKLVEGVTVTALLRRELRETAKLDGWFAGWARARGLLDPKCAWLRIEPDGLLPNPLRFLLPRGPGTRLSTRYLAGRTHGDLHGDNILIPIKPDGTPDAAAFRLIDLADYDGAAPLSRDIATVLIATLAHEVKDLPPGQPDALIRYLVHRDPSAKTKLLASWVALVDALLRTDDLPFLKGGWQDTWSRQLTVSLLAQALRHSTYKSVGLGGRWWSLRLAAHLAGQLLPGQMPPSARPRLLTSEIVADLAEDDAKEGPNVAAAPGRSARRLQTAPFPPAGATTAADGGNATLVNRYDEQAQLRRALLGDGSPIVVVNGAAGVGKTKLVSAVLDGLEGKHRDIRVRRHSLSPTAGLDVKSLLDDIEDGPPLDVRQRAGESALARLELALDTTTDGRVFILIDSVDQLIRAGAGGWVAPDLNEAFDMLARARSKWVRVVLVAQDQVPREQAAVWLSGAERVPVNGLAFEHFLTFIDQLGGRARDQLLTAAPSLEDLRGRLKGNPRLVELLYAIVSQAGGRWAQRQLDHFGAMSEEQIARVLTGKLVDGLSVYHKPVVEALAAFGTTVTADQVTALLAGRLDRDEVSDALDKLVEWRVVRRTADRLWFSVPTSDLDQLLRHLPEEGEHGRLRLIYHAANVLFRERTADDRIRGVDDLRVHFDDLDALIRAQQFQAAFGLIRQMDDILIRWNCTDLLLDRRRKLRGHLEPDEELSNDNAIGNDCVARGLFAEAAQAYDLALERVAYSEDPSVEQKLSINRGAMFWDEGRTHRAAQCFAEAMRTEFTDPEDEAAALEGLADCDRRWGRHPEAVSKAHQALSVAQQADSVLAVTVALKLARWYIETGKLDRAETILEAAADAAAKQQDAASWQPALLEGRADLYLARHELDMAVATADQAIRAAQVHRDPVVVLQARTTLCLAHLYPERRDVAAAARAVGPTAELRQGRSLLVLALLGLVAHLQGNHPVATQHFGQLREKAEERQRQDPDDFAALDMEALAMCYSRLDADETLERARELFRTARCRSQHASGLADRMVVLVELLARHDRHRTRLAPLIAVLKNPDCH